MGIPTTDERNPGRRQVRKFIPEGVLDGSFYDHPDVQPFGFKVLKNCRLDKRLAAVVKRGGSVDEGAGSGLGIPLGVGEFISKSGTGSLPFNRALLFAFSGSFKRLVAGTWTTVPQTSFVNFNTSRQMKMAQLGIRSYIAGGRPAHWSGPGYTIERVGIVPPTTAPSVAGVAGAGEITLVDGAQYMYTLYLSTTGLESDWSPLSTTSGPVTAKSLTINLPSMSAENWDSIRIYRTLDGGSIPYLVNTVPAGTVTYIDNTADEDLTTRATDEGDNGLPPDDSFICEAFAQCIWYVDANNPFRLVFSKPYTGSEVDLEYFPADNFLITTKPITGLLAVPGKLLIFHPRDISYITGTSAEDFILNNFVSGVGTVFANSPSTNGTDIFFLAEQGCVAIPAQGGKPRHISREIDLPDLQSLLAGSYNSQMFVSSCWSPSMRQFLFMLNAASSAGAPWEEVGTGDTGDDAEWIDSISLADDIWEDIANPNTSYAMRNKLWGWSPELSSPQKNMWMEYTFSDFADQNLTGAYPIFVFHPQPSNDTGDPQQDRTYIGWYNGTEGKIKTAFRKDLNTDNASAFTAEILTDKICPGAQTGGFKLFHGIGFNGAYSDPTSDSLGTLKYLVDFEDPHMRSYTGQLVAFATGSVDFKRAPTMQGRYFHIHLSDTSQSQTKILLSEFFIHFRERFRREGR